MTTQQFSTATPPQPTKPARKRDKKWWFISPALLIAGIIIGNAAGGLAGDESVATVEPETMTVTETVEVTPESCLEAIYEARLLMTLSADLSDAMGDVFVALPAGMEAAAAWDVAGIEMFTGVIEQVTSDINAITAQVEESSFLEASLECEFLAGGAS